MSPSTAADKTVVVAISTPTGAVVADASGTASVLNDDGAAYLAAGNISVVEGDSGTTAASFTITRSGNTTGSSTVKYKTADGTATVANGDYTAITTLVTVTFGPGETTKSATVNVTGDTVDEVNETFTLLLSAAVGASLSDASGRATIVDDD